MGEFGLRERASASLVGQVTIKLLHLVTKAVSGRFPSLVLGSARFTRKICVVSITAQANGEPLIPRIRPGDAGCHRLGVHLPQRVARPDRDIEPPNSCVETEILGLVPPPSWWPNLLGWGGRAYRPPSLGRSCICGRCPFRLIGKLSLRLLS